MRNVTMSPFAKYLGITIFEKGTDNVISMISINTVDSTPLELSKLNLTVKLINTMEYLQKQIDIGFQQTTLYQYDSNPSPKYVTVKSIYVQSDNLNYEKF